MPAYATHTFPSISTSDRDELEKLVADFPRHETFLEEVVTILEGRLSLSKSPQGSSAVGSDSDEDNEGKSTSESTKTFKEKGSTSNGGDSRKRPAAQISKGTTRSDRQTRSTTR